MKTINLVLRFLLELAALASLGYWGYHALPGVGGVLLCIAAPIGFAVLWGLFAAHRAKYPPQGIWKDVVGFLFLEMAAVALALAGQPIWAGLFAVLVAGNAVLLRIWNGWS